MIRRTVLFACVVLSLLIFQSPVLAEVTNSLDVSADVRIRGEVRNNGDLNDGNSDRQDYVLQRTQVNISWNKYERLELFTQLQDGRAWGEEGSQRNPGSLRVLDEAVSGADEQGADLNQVYLDIKDVGKEGNYLRLGRQEIKMAGQRLIGVHGWSNHRRAFDGALFDYEMLDGWRGKTFAIMLAETGSDSSDVYMFGWSAEGRETFTGGMLEPYVLYMDDNRKTYSSTRSGGGVPLGTGSGTDALSVWTLGVRGHWNLTDRLDLEMQALKQLGTRGDFDLDAEAFHGRATYQVDYAFLRGFVAEYNYGSGDDDPNDDDIGTLNDLNPRHTNHPNHDKYGSFDLGSWRNQESYMVGVQLNPVGNLGLDIHYWKFDLAESNDYWYQANGTTYLDPTSVATNSTDAGNEIDFELSIPWREFVNINAGYALFQPGDLPEDAGRNDDGDWSYIQVSAAF